MTTKTKTIVYINYTLWEKIRRNWDVIALSLCAGLISIGLAAGHIVERNEKAQEAAVMQQILTTLQEIKQKQ